MFYIYCILDPRKPGNYKYGEIEFEFEPFYVGKASKRRLKNTLTYKGKSNTIKNNKLNAINGVNLKPILKKIKEFENEQDAFDCEKFFIKLIGRINENEGPLCNLTEGGDGITGYKHTDSARKKISQTHKGIVKSKEWIENLRNSHIGYKMTEDAKLKLSKINSVPKPYRRNFYKLTHDDGFEIVTEYLEKTCDELNLPYHTITQYCRKNKKYKGYKCIKINKNELQS